MANKITGIPEDLDEARAPFTEVRLVRGYEGKSYKRTLCLVFTLFLEAYGSISFQDYYKTLFVMFKICFLITFLQPTMRRDVSTKNRHIKSCEGKLTTSHNYRNHISIQRVPFRCSFCRVLANPFMFATHR